MTENKTTTEIYQDLIKTIQGHDVRYYNHDAPIISDREYDLLFAQLKKFEAENPDMVRPDSPSQRVGQIPQKGFSRIQHVHRMYSLDNSYNEQDILDFTQRVQTGLGSDTPVYVVEPKLDGASMEIVYQDGRFTQAITRGNGIEGEEVTTNIKTIKSLPLVIDHLGRIIVRGEVFINSADLAAINVVRAQNGEHEFANPRNAASGAIRLLDSKETAKRPLRIFLYELVEAPGMMNSHSDALQFLEDAGLPVHKMQQKCATVPEILKALAYFDDLRKTLPFEIDGAVIKVDSLEQREVLGHTSRFPKWAMAYKFETIKAQTKLLAIDIQVGRTGVLTPVAKLEPVQLAGTTVAKASLHNEDEIKSKDIRVGDTVIIEKAGEIIPYVVDVIKADEKIRSEPFSMPVTCPICGSKTQREAGEAKWRCQNNYACPGQLKAFIRHFCIRSAMDIEHIGPSLIDQLVETELVKSPADLYTLQLEQLMNLERMGAKSAQNILDAVEKSKTRPLHSLLTGLGIPLVGEVAAKQLSARFVDLSEFASADPQKIRADLAEEHGIGEKMADSVARFLENPYGIQVVQKLLTLGINLKSSIQEKSPEGPLKGMSFCATGKLSQSRPKIHELIQNAGGEVHKAVKKGTTYLIAGENVGKNKTDKAEKLGTKVIDEEIFQKMVGLA